MTTTGSKFKFAKERKVSAGYFSLAMQLLYAVFREEKAITSKSSELTKDLTSVLQHSLPCQPT